MSTNLSCKPSFEIRLFEVQILRLRVRRGRTTPFFGEFVCWSCKRHIEFRSDWWHPATIQPILPVHGIQFLLHLLAIFARKPFIQKVFELFGR